MSTHTYQKILARYGLLDEPPYMLLNVQAAEMKERLRFAYNCGLNAGIEQAKADHLKELTDEQR